MNTSEDEHQEYTRPEKWWASIQPFLERQGYLLRPRYRPGWTPPDESLSQSSYGLYEDTIMQRVS